MRVWCRLVALGAGCCLVGAGVSAQVVTLHVQERPPYSQVEPNGEVHGLVADPAAQALTRAGVAWRWAITPSQRQLALVQSGEGLHCGVGWFRTEARAALGRFSGPLYRDQPFGALVRDQAGMPPGLSAPALLSDRRWRLLVKEGYSYGRFFDELIARIDPPRVRTHAELPQMSLMLRTGRADWMIVAPEEAAQLGGDGLSLYRLPDMPPGPTRHLYCSADVPAEWIARIDAALPPLPPP